MAELCDFAKDKMELEKSIQRLINDFQNKYTGVVVSALSIMNGFEVTSGKEVACKYTYADITVE